MERRWIHLTNPFRIATDNNYTAAAKISAWHKNALALAGAGLPATLLATYGPIDEAYQLVYDTWHEKGEDQQGDTLSLRQLLQQLSSKKIRVWDVAIQAVYEQDTPHYKSLLPNRRAPFQQGGQLERISAVGALKLAITGDVSLASTVTDVTAFHTLLTDTYGLQKGKLSSTKTSSATVEEVRIPMCDAQYGNMGALIASNPAHPELFDGFFDLETIRNAQQVEFTGHVPVTTIHFVVRHTFHTGETVTLINNGTVPLDFYLAHDKNELPGTVKVTVPAHTTMEVEADLLGSLTNRILLVYNASGAVIGEFTLSF